MFTLNRKGATTIVDGVLLSYLIEDVMEDPEVPTEHLHEEIHHHAEHSREKWVLGVALSSALLAGFAAVCSLMAGHHANEAMMSQIESTDQWGYYQSKGIKETALTSKAEILDALGKPVSAADKEKVGQYQRDKELIAKKADELEKEAADARATKSAFDNGSRKLAQFHYSFDCSAKEPESMWQLHDQSPRVSPTHISSSKKHDRRGRRRDAE